MAAEAVKQTNGMAISISDADILQAQKKFIRKTGILCEPSSAAAYAAFMELKDDKVVRNKSVLLLITGNGLKDTKNLVKN